MTAAVAKLVPSKVVTRYKDDFEELRKDMAGILAKVRAFFVRVAKKKTSAVGRGTTRTHIEQEFPTIFAEVQELEDMMAKVNKQATHCCYDESAIRRSKKRRLECLNECVDGVITFTYNFATQLRTPNRAAAGVIAKRDDLLALIDSAKDYNAQFGARVRKYLTSDIFKQKLADPESAVDIEEGDLTGTRAEKLEFMKQHDPETYTKIVKENDDIKKMIASESEDEEEKQTRVRENGTDAGATIFEVEDEDVCTEDLEDEEDDDDDDDEDSDDSEEGDGETQQNGDHVEEASVDNGAAKNDNGENGTVENGTVENGSAEKNGDDDNALGDDDDDIIILKKVDGRPEDEDEDDDDIDEVQDLLAGNKTLELPTAENTFEHNGRAFRKRGQKHAAMNEYQQLALLAQIGDDGEDDIDAPKKKRRYDDDEDEDDEDSETKSSIDNSDLEPSEDDELNAILRGDAVNAAEEKQNASPVEIKDSEEEDDVLNSL